MSKPSLLQTFQALPLHPLFFAAYPVLALVGININEVEPAVLWRPLLILLLSAALMLVLLGRVTRDWHRAALLLSIFIPLFSHHNKNKRPSEARAKLTDEDIAPI